MEKLLNELILSESKEGFFEILSKFYHQNCDKHVIMNLPNSKEKAAIMKLYHLLFASDDDHASYQALLMDGLLKKSYIAEKDALEIYPLLKKEARRFFQLAILPTENLSVCKQFEKTVPNLLWMIKDGQTVFIFTFNHGPFVPTATKQTLLSILEANQCEMYLSYPYNQLIDSAEFYRQTTLFSNIATTHQELIIEFATSYLNTLFASVSHRHFLSSFVHPNIKRMIEHDQKYHTLYYQTLKTYLENKKDIQKTIECLDINRSTLFYRFKQIGKMLGQDFYELDLFALEFSIRLHEYLNN